MKHLKGLAFACLLVITFSSCTSSKWIAPPYTSVDKISMVRQGMSIQDVNSTLGIPPYNIYHIQEDGSSLLMYNYRIKDRAIKLVTDTDGPNDRLRNEQSQAEGTPYYQMESQRVFVLFKDGKVRSLITDAGIENSEYVMLINNNLKLLSQEDLSKLSIKKVGDVYILDQSSASMVVKVDKVEKKPTLLGQDVQQNKKGSGWAAIGLVAVLVLGGLGLAAVIAALGV